jgi:hypothetical protein
MRLDELEWKPNQTRTGVDWEDADFTIRGRRVIFSRAVSPIATGCDVGNYCVCADLQRYCEGDQSVCWTNISALEAQCILIAITSGVTYEIR